LYTAMTHLFPALPAIWGAVALGAIVLNLLSLILRRVGVAATSAFLGALVWIFAAWVYLLGGDYLIFVSVTLPNLFFWVWYYLDFKSRR